MGTHVALEPQHTLQGKDPLLTGLGTRTFVLFQDRPDEHEVFRWRWIVPFHRGEKDILASSGAPIHSLGMALEKAYQLVALGTLAEMTYSATVIT